MRALLFTLLAALCLCTPAWAAGCTGPKRSYEFDVSSSDYDLAVIKHLENVKTASACKKKCDKSRFCFGYMFVRFRDGKGFVRFCDLLDARVYGFELVPHRSPRGVWVGKCSYWTK